MKKIKNCPFCGSEAKGYEVSREYTKREDRYFVACTNKECGAIIDCDSEEEAVEKWNRRKP